MEGTTLKDILRRVVEAKRFTRGWHDEVKNRRKLYDGDHYKDKPKPNEPQYVDPTFMNTVDLAVGILHSEDVIWHAQGFNKTPQEAKHSDIVEKAVAGFIDVNIDRTQIDLWHTINMNFVRDGGGILYGVWDKDIHDNCREQSVMTDPNGMQMPIEVLYELPLDIRAIDPLNIFLLPGGTRRWLSVMRIEEMSVYDVEKHFGVTLSKFKHLDDSSKLDQKGELIDYWDYAYENVIPDDYEPPVMEELEDTDEIPQPPTVRKMVVRNAVLFNQEYIIPLRTMEGYNDIPYTINFYNPTDPKDSSKWNSILTPLESPVKDLEISVNRRQQMINMYSSLPLVVRTEGAKPVSMPTGMGKVVSLDLNEDAGFPEWRGSPPDVDKQAELYRSRIQQSGFSDVMFGQGPSGISGYALTQLGDQNRIRLETAIKHLENLWTWAARKWLDMMEEFAPDTYIELYGHIRGADFVERIKGDDLQGFNVRCEIRAEFPNERVRNHAMATQVAQFLSPQTIMENYLGIQQPEDERQKKLIALAEQDPMLLKYATIKKMEQMAYAGDIAAQIVMEQMQAQLMQGQGQAQQQPRNPEQPMGIQASNGQPTPTAPSPEDAISRALEAQAQAAPQMTTGAIGNEIA